MERLRQLFMNENGPSYENLTTSVSFQSPDIYTNQYVDLTLTNPSSKPEIQLISTNSTAKSQEFISTSKKIKKCSKTLFFLACLVLLGIILRIVFVISFEINNKNYDANATHLLKLNGYLSTILKMKFLKVFLNFFNFSSTRKENF